MDAELILESAIEQNILDVYNHPNKMDTLSHSSNITFKFVKKYENASWNWGALLQNPRIPRSFIYKKILSLGHVYTITFIKLVLFEEYDTDYIEACNDEILLSFPNVKVSFTCMDCIFDFDILKKYLARYTDEQLMSSRANLTTDNILELLQLYSN